MLPMLAKRIDELPAGHTWIFEPKWDGFRALIFCDRDEILIQSRDAKSLNRYFPELLEPLNAQLPARCVLDGALQNLGFGKQQLIPARFSRLRIEPVPFGKR
jgi:ATP-dependent DNA ligase